MLALYNSSLLVAAAATCLCPVLQQLLCFALSQLQAAHNRHECHDWQAGITDFPFYAEYVTSGQSLLCQEDQLTGHYRCLEGVTAAPIGRGFNGDCDIGPNWWTCEGASGGIHGHIKQL